MLQAEALLAYLAELAQNNNRDWFEAQRPRYQALRREFADLVQSVIFRLGEFDAHLQGLRAEDAIFRIHRDVRFAKDKTPYKTVFSASLCPEGRAADMPTYYLQIAHTGRLLAAAGVHTPQLEAATRIRQAIAAHPIQVEQILAQPALHAAFPPGLSSEAYKRPPKGFDEATPLLHLIKLKSFVLWNEVPLPPTLSGDQIADMLVRDLRAAVPWVEFLRSALRVA